MKELNYAAYAEIFVDEEKTGLIIFSRKTCHVCQKVQPLILELEKEFPQISFYHVDADIEENLMNKCKVKGVPQLLYIKDGEEVYRLAGEYSYDEYAEGIESFL